MEGLTLFDSWVNIALFLGTMSVREIISYFPLIKRYFNARVVRSEKDAGIQHEDNKPALTGESNTKEE